MADNASNNEIAIEYLESLFLEKFGAKATIILAKEHQLGCFSDNLNLSVKDLLFGKDSNAIETSGVITVNDEKEIETAFLT